MSTPQVPELVPETGAMQSSSRASLKGVKVACFYPWNPFEYSGAWIRFTCLWRFLLEEGAEVTLAFLDRGQDIRLKNFSARYVGDYNMLSSIGAHAQKVLAEAGAQSELKLYSPTELTFLLMFEKGLYLTNPKVGPWLEEIVSSHDVITCEYPMFAPLLSDYCRRLQRPFVVTCLDILFELHCSHPRAKAHLKEKEVAALGAADARVYCNDEERKFFASLGLDGTTVLNTGDALGIALTDEQQARDAIRAALKIKTPHYCLFVGGGHKPNIDAAAEIRRMAKRMPEITFVIAGNCCAATVESNFISLGYTADETIDQLHRGALAIIVPLMHGTGMSLKMYQAFAHAKAVVATPVGARGYSVADQKELLIVKSPAEFPAAIRRLMTDENLRRSLGRVARGYALSLDFRTHFRPYGEIIRSLLNRAPTQDSKATPSLFLIDNNLVDRIGHHYNYALSLKEQCAAHGIPFCALIKTTAKDDIQSELAAIGTFSQGIHEESPLNPYPHEWSSIRSTYDLLLSNDCFARELEVGLCERARPGDTVFLPNATPRQMLGLAMMLVKRPAFRTLQFVLILRYSTFVAFGPITARKTALDKETAQQYQVAFERLLAPNQSACIRLATDSSELAREFAALAKRPVEVFPIPHTQDEGDAASLDIQGKRPGEIRLVYLGDAREEKGFELLPLLVRACAANPAMSNVTFAFQAFISSHYHQRMGLVIAELERLNVPNLRLVKTSLTPGAYQGLLRSADLVLLPYDAGTYRARTSGPFIEAICADKPVVIPRNSWMSGELGESRAGTTFLSGNPQDFVAAAITAIANIAQHSEAAAKLGARFRQFHNPGNFVHALMKIEKSVLVPQRT